MLGCALVYAVMGYSMQGCAIEYLVINSVYSDVLQHAVMCNSVCSVVK